MEQITALSRRILVKCAHRLGGVGALARHLEVAEATLAEWLSGKSVPPIDLVIKAVHPFIDDAEPSASPALPAARRPLDH